MIFKNTFSKYVKTNVEYKIKYAKYITFMLFDIWKYIDALCFYRQSLSSSSHFIDDNCNKSSLWKDIITFFVDTYA